MYTIGIDYGTLSGRAILADQNGKELATCAYDYPHAVMDQTLPDGTPLGQDWALQHPQDYLDVLDNTIPQLLRESGVNPAQIVGIGVDFTACTILPVKRDGTPLCFLEAYRSQPHAYVKLWKHHSAQKYANLLNDIARERGETFLERYGGKISSEWQIPKIWQIVEEAPQIYDQADFILEAGDWIVWQLTGRYTRGSCASGYKALWHKRDGYPSPAFFKALHPKLEHLVEEKFACPVSPLGQKAGELTPQIASRLGLLPGTAVAVANVDAHVCVPAVQIDGPGKMLMIMGTSTCHMVSSEKEIFVPGICGVVEDGILPGLYGYEAGQSCVGDHFAWFIQTALPAGYLREAELQGKGIYQYLREKASLLRPGESGLMALDWWNGNRSVLVDADLTGLLLGMTLQTKPEEIYRALIEATAYGTRKIIETFEASGVAIHQLYASGGISQKDPMTMQIYADVVKKPIRIAGSSQGPALGAAIFGAVAAGSTRGGYDTVQEAARRMGSLREITYTPTEENARIYDQLYAEYDLLHDYFGTGTNDVMKRLKKLKEAVKS